MCTNSILCLSPKYQLPSRAVDGKIAVVNAKCGLARDRRTVITKVAVDTSGVGLANMGMSKEVN